MCLSAVPAPGEDGRQPAGLQLGGGWLTFMGLEIIERVGRDRRRTRVLEIGEFSAALSGQGFELIVFDSCMMASLEVAYQLRDAGRYMVASEEVSWVGGFPYLDFPFDLNANPDMDGLALGKTLVDLTTTQHLKNPELANSFTYSLIDLGAVRDLGLAVDEWALAMRANMNVLNVRGVLLDNAQIGVRNARSRSGRSRLRRLR